MNRSSIWRGFGFCCQASQLYVFSNLVQYCLHTIFPPVQEGRATQLYCQPKRHDLRHMWIVQAIGEDGHPQGHKYLSNYFWKRSTLTSRMVFAILDIRHMCIPSVHVWANRIQEGRRSCWLRLVHRISILLQVSRRSPALRCNLILCWLHYQLASYIQY